MRLSQFFDTQTIDRIQWNEPEEETLAYRYPMLDMAIQMGAKLTVGPAEMAVMVDEGRIADVFAPGIYALNPACLPTLSRMKHWNDGSPVAFKSDIYFFSTRPETEQKWGTGPIAPRSGKTDAFAVRGYGSYSYRIADAPTFFTQVSGTRESYSIYDLDERLRDTIAACMVDVVAVSGVSHLESKGQGGALGERIEAQIRVAFAAYGLELIQFAIEDISLQQAQQGPMTCRSCGAGMRSDHGVFKCDYCHAVIVPGVDGGGIVEPVGEACPCCASPLLHAKIGRASLMYCTRCDGMLVAMEELELLVAASRALGGGAAAVRNVNGAHTPASVACPECRSEMRRRGYPGAKNVAIECCENCGLNWLDHAELARIAHGPAAESRFDADHSHANFNPAQTDSPVGLGSSV